MSTRRAVPAITRAAFYLVFSYMPMYLSTGLGMRETASLPRESRSPFADE